MNDLQLGLIGLGAAAVLGVYAYNKWQEYRHRKLAKHLLQHDHADILMAGRPHGTTDFPDAVEAEAPARESRFSAFRRVLSSGEEETPAPGKAEPQLEAAPDAGFRQEPSLYREPVAEAPAFEAPEAPVEPPPAPAPATLPPQPAIPPVTVPSAEPPAAQRIPETSSVLSSVTDDEGVPAILVSPVIDYVARLELVEPEAGGTLLEAQDEFLSRISKPVSWAGFNERSGQWERVVPEGEYRRLRIGLLLADRRGPVGEADLLTFQGAMQGLAEEFMALADLPPRDPALAAAIALDQFCAQVDIQIGLNLISHGQQFAGTKIRALAEAAGMVLDSSGRFARCDDDGRVLYTLSNQESSGFSPESMRTMSTHGLVFTLDVACVDHGDRVFAQMLDLARRMSDVLHGILVDDNRRPLTENILGPFRRQIAQYQSQLAARGIPAGGPLAIRLFS